MYKISVIIPIYNVEQYLSKCIDSIVKQTIGFENNVQLILIDDYSTDNSYAIAEQYANKYKNNIIVKRLEKNSGSGGKPRNIGMKYATGKYLMFSDADDLFEIDAFQIMYNEIEEKNADIVVSNMDFMDSDGRVWNYPYFDSERFDNFELNIEDYEKSFYVMNSSMCNKIFRRLFIEENDICCLEYVSGEDTYFSMKAFLCAKKMYYINNILYYYRQRNASQKTASRSWNCSKEYFYGINIAYKKLYNLFIEKEQLQFYRLLYARNMLYLLYKFIDTNQLNNQEKIETLSELKWFFKLSKSLKIPVSQNSLQLLIDSIIGENYSLAIEVSMVIAEMRTYMPVETRQSMTKPGEDVYEKIRKITID